MATTKPIYSIPLICGIATITLTVLLSKQIEEREKSFIDLIVDEEATQIVLAMQSSVDNSVTALSRLGRRWEAAGGTPRVLWDDDAINYLADFPALTTIEWVDRSYHVRWIEPLAGNEKALGLNIAFNDERKQALIGAAKENKITLTPPLDLIQGYRAFIAYIPLHIDGEFDGFIVGIFDSNVFLNSTVPEEIVENYHISVSDSNSDKTLFESAAAKQGIDDLDIISKSFPFTIYNRTWTLQLTPSVKFINNYQSKLSSHLILGSILLTLLVVISTYYALVSREKNKQLKKQKVDLINTQNQRDAAIENIADGLITLDANGNIKSFNKACEKLFHYKPEEVIGNNIKLLMPSPYAEQHDGYIENHQKNR